MPNKPRRWGAPAPRRPRMTAASRADRIMAVSAIVTAVAAVVIGVYEARATREYQRLSVWPAVRQFNSYPPGAAYTRNVANVGMGPAVIGSFQVRVDGVAQRSWNDVLRAMIGETHPELIYTTVGEGTVVLPGTTEVILRLPEGELARRFFVATQEGRLETRVCYCSVYEECWISTGNREVEPIRSCVTSPEDEFRQ